MAKDIKWEKVNFSKQPKQDACELTFRSTGQMVFSTGTLEALGYPQHVHLLISSNEKMMAIKATHKSDGDTVQLSSKQLEKGKPHVVMSRKVYTWLLGLLGQKEDKLIRLTGSPNQDNMVVFDLKKAEIKGKRARRKNGEAKG